jgi:uncharacterized GH25 family protein
MKTIFQFLRGALGLGLLTSTLWAQDEPAKLDGLILGADNQPLPNALVTVFSAAPREGQHSTVGIKHYPDCGKHVRTDAQGRFVMTGINKELLFRLLVSAPGHRPDYIRDADPQFGGAQLKLKPLRFNKAPASQRVIGKLIDPAGRPVTGARIEVNGVRYGDVSYSSAFTTRVDPMALSDEKGEFFLDCTNDLNSLTVTIDAPRLAKRRAWLDLGKAHLIRLKSGVTVTGRVLNAGKPVPQSTITMDTQDRESSVFLKGFEVSTDTSGRFSLQHVPADTALTLYTRIKEMEETGAGLAPKPVSTSAEASTLDLGDLEMSPAYTVRGRVLLSDGQPVPGRTRIYLSLENGSDSKNTTLDPDGWFEFLGVPADQVSITLRIPGYRVSAKNPSKDWLNEGRLVGRLEKAWEEFFIHLEPGPAFSRGDGPTENRQPRDKPLQPAKIDA